MTHYEGAVPAYEQAVDWRDFAVCKADADAMFPDNNETGIAKAKKNCGACTVRLACLRDAILTSDDQYGIRGGLKPDERRQVADHLADGRLDDAALEAAVLRTLHPVHYGRTLRDIWNERTFLLPEGHLGWRGAVHTAITFQGRMYTPKRVSFQVGRGREPQGVVRSVCRVTECVNPRHLADNVDRHRAQEAAKQAKAAAS